MRDSLLVDAQMWNAAPPAAMGICGAFGGDYGLAAHRRLAVGHSAGGGHRCFSGLYLRALCRQSSGTGHNAYMGLSFVHQYRWLGHDGAVAGVNHRMSFIFGCQARKWRWRELPQGCRRAAMTSRKRTFGDVMSGGGV